MSSRMVLLACAMAAFVASAHAEATSAVYSVAPADLRKSTALPAQAFVANLRAHSDPQGSGAKGNQLDTTPPVLTGFSMVAPADVAKPFAQVMFDIDATDDLSGVGFVTVTIQGPHGQSVYATASTEMPARRSHRTIAADVSAYLEPGVWTVTYLAVWDEANNAAVYGPDQIAAIGQSTLEIVNSRANLVDLTSPSLVSGKILTPTVSISGHPKGTQGNPLVGAELTLADTGSGVDIAFPTWCLPDMSSCLRLSASSTINGQKHAVMQAVGAIYSPPPLGTYRLYGMEVLDKAGNNVYMMSSEFGGNVDFSTYFPDGSSITIAP